jgi:hypothetical protein
VAGEKRKQKAADFTEGEERGVEREEKPFVMPLAFLRVNSRRRANSVARKKRMSGTIFGGWSRYYAGDGA